MWNLLWQFTDYGSGMHSQREKSLSSIMSHLGILISHISHTYNKET